MYTTYPAKVVFGSFNYVQCRTKPKLMTHEPISLIQIQQMRVQRGIPQRFLSKMVDNSYGGK